MLSTKDSSGGATHSCPCQALLLLLKLGHAGAGNAAALVLPPPLLLLELVCASKACMLQCVPPCVCHDLQLAALSTQIIEQQLGATGTLGVHTSCTPAAPQHNSAAVSTQAS
jgi:hypothetical protein